MFTYTYTCIYIYVYVCVYTYIYLKICIYVQKYIHIHIHIYIYTCIHTKLVQTNSSPYNHPFTSHTTATHSLIHTPINRPKITYKTHI